MSKAVKAEIGEIKFSVCLSDFPTNGISDEMTDELLGIPNAEEVSQLIWLTISFRFDVDKWSPAIMEDRRRAVLKIVNRKKRSRT